MNRCLMMKFAFYNLLFLISFKTIEENTLLAQLSSFFSSGSKVSEHQITSSRLEHLDM